ncbi:hypothetical protein [Methylomonas rhizoryzae]|uniref:hypothetical protein n=1 Tax=Methylomonas rhizoryzae TaxID=2608981 RepID=UPI001232E96E|nr:hypothetical protein [Methylomonas rhizoryzae]
MSETLENIQTVTGVARTIGAIIAQRYGGETGQAAAAYLLGQPVWVAAAADMVAKTQDGTIPNSQLGEELAEVFSQTANTLSGFGYLADFADIGFLQFSGYTGLLLIAYENTSDKRLAKS